jgi:hypothetical protein
MGTQFTSRLKSTDRERIYKGIVEALTDQLPLPSVKKPEPEASKRRKKGGGVGLPGKPASAAKKIKSMSSVQRQRFGDATVSQVLNVVADHGFFTVFEDSQLFVDVLKWLLRLRSDAEYNGFEGIIQEYGMAASVNPVGDLARKLEGLTDKARSDPFRVAATNAAKAILFETSLRRVAPKAGEAPARTFGRRLATLSVADLVKLYIHRFVYEVLSKSMSMSDPSSSAIVVQAIGEVQKATERIAKKAVDQIVKEGKLNDPQRIHQIVIEGLREYRKPKAA